MKEEDKLYAQRRGRLEKYEALEEALLKIKGVVPEKHCNGIDMDLCGLNEDTPHPIVCLVPGYNIPLQPNYFTQRRAMIKEIIETCKAFGLRRTPDSIEDYGEHLYFVFEEE